MSNDKPKRQPTEKQLAYWAKLKERKTPSNSFTAVPTAVKGTPAEVVNGYTIPVNAGFANRFHIYDAKGKIYCSSARTMEAAIVLAKSFPPIDNTVPSVVEEVEFEYEVVNGYKISPIAEGYGRFTIYDSKGKLFNGGAETLEKSIELAKSYPAQA